MYAGTLAESAQAALAVLGKTDILSNAYLAGGSALALHLGHRKSFDFDFYMREKVLARDVAAQLAKIGEFQTRLLKPPHTLQGEFNGVKISLFRYDYPLIRPPTKFLDVKIASIADIAAMKLTAICGRATRRDYVDLYVICRNQPIETLLEWYEQKFGSLGNNLYVIIRALNYFADAEKGAMPEMLTSLSWGEVKRFFADESLRLAKKYLG